MLKNFQRYFRFYLASFLLGLLLVGIRWQAAPLGTAEVEKQPPALVPATSSVHVGAGTAAIHIAP